MFCQVRGRTYRRTGSGLLQRTRYLYWSKCAVLSAVRDCDYKGVSKNQIMASVRKALKTGQDFKLYYVDNESANGPLNNKTGWVVEP